MISITLDGPQRPAPSGRASKKLLNSGRSPREPKSDAKLQPPRDMAKCFHEKIEKQ